MMKDWLLRLIYYIFFSVYGVVKYLPTPIGDITRFIVLKIFLAKINTYCIHEGVTFKHLWRTEIGKNTDINEFVYFNSFGRITIGNDVLIGQSTRFYAFEHAFEDVNVLIRNQPLIARDITVEDNVYIGTNVIILGGSIIKKGAVLGAGSVVKGVVPENAIVAGVPAKLIRYRGTFENQ